MSTVLPVSCSSGHRPSSPRKLFEVQFCMLRTHCRPYSLGRCGTFILTIIRNHFFLISLIPPSAKLRFRRCGSVMLKSIEYFLTFVINSVLRPHCSCKPSNVNRSGRPNSLMNCRSAPPAPHFAVNGKATAKKSLFANICAYRFPPALPVHCVSAKVATE